MIGQSTQFRRLLRLLGCTLLATDILADVGSITSLADDALEGSPGVAGGGRGALVGELGVDPGGQRVDGLLDEAALGNTRAEEDGVDGEQDPRALLEEERRAEHAEPETDLEEGNERHGAVIVLLDELANGLRGT